MRSLVPQPGMETMPEQLKASPETTPDNDTTEPEIPAFADRRSARFIIIGTFVFLVLFVIVELMRRI